MSTPRFARTNIQQVYMKPLIPKGFEHMLKPERVLQILKRDILKRTKAAFKLQDAFTKRARVALAKSLKVELLQSSIRVSTNHPAFRPIVFGMASRQMTWLTKSKKPIPIITDEGKLIFRVATPRSMANGSWIHPGHKKTNFLDKVREETRSYVTKRVTEEIQKQLRLAMRKAAGL
jgi:hypothetical protein